MKAAPFTKEISKNVGIWIRVSTEDQAKGESPAHHLERARAYAKAKGWAVKEVYDLSGVSGKSVVEHSEAKRMLADVKRGHISGLAFSKLARLARNTRELLDFSDYFRTHNADLISLQESIDTSTPAGRLFYTIIAAMAQWEREEIADRVKSSIKIRAQLGKSLGGAAPFGYQWKDNKLVVEPTEAPVRKLMYELFVKSRRMKGVARQLNEAGYRTRKGAKFSDTTVERLLEDTTAKGLYRANHTYRDGAGKLHFKPESEWMYSPVERIISDELWNECNALLRHRKDKKPPGPKTVHLFAGILWCGCGHKMYVFSRSPKYICPTCRTKIPMEDIEAIFREQLRSFFVSPEKVGEHLEKADEHLAENETRLAEHTRQLEAVRAEMQKVYRLYTSDKITPDGFGDLYRPLEVREKQLAQALPELEAKVDALKINRISADEVIAEAVNLYQSWPCFSPEERRQLVESITEKIVVSGDAVDITLSYMPSCEDFTKRQRNLSDSWPPPT
jgi:site-specific DNA recombinase